MSKPFYITTTLPYVNADPHIGFALEIVQADIVARFKALMGHEVFFNTGTDEHGLKIWRNAEAAGKEPQVYVDEYAARFKLLKEKLGLFPELHFIRTTDPHHKAAAQEFWKRCTEAGDIYKKKYSIKYCVGCELEKTDSELVEGKCPLHPTYTIELIEEENYFFRFSKYQQPLLEMYAKNPDFVVPDFRFNEIKAFVERGLEDFSISRLASKMPWGVPVPDDNSQVMYVWFDALINYVSTLGWPENTELFEKFWGFINGPRALQIAGKDNIRQQSAMWQAMLLSAGLPTTRQVAIHGFITSGGQKMSKSLGNVINPIELVDEYGTDALRIFLARHVHPFEDSDVTLEKFKESYNADLANGLGNLAARIMTLAEKNLEAPVARPEIEDFDYEYVSAIERFEFNVATNIIWRKIAVLDMRLTTEKPFSIIKTDLPEGRRIISECVVELYSIARHLTIFMPSTSAAIKEAVLANKKPTNLFPRKE